MKKNGLRSICLGLIMSLCLNCIPVQLSLAAANNINETKEPELADKELKAKEAREKAGKRYKELNKDKFVVRFDAKGGTEANFDVGLLKSGECLGKSIYAPERSGYTFLGWYTQKDKLVEYNTILKSEKDIVLYAKWKKVEPSKFKVTFIMPVGKEKKVHVVPEKKIGVLPKSEKGETIVWCRKNINGKIDGSIDEGTIVHETDCYFYVMRVIPLDNVKEKEYKNRNKV